MKSLLIFASKVFLALGFVSSAFTALAVQPTDPPPRGHAYGYWMKDGGRVVLLYVDQDGSRLITLLYCKPNARYIVEASVDMKSWHTLAQLRVGADGTARVTDSTPEEHCFYRVIRLPEK